MVKSVKGKPEKAAQPGIWAEGRQHPPLESDVLARVTIIQARRAAARAWNKASALVADAAFAVEDGFGTGLVGGLGRAAAILPSRATVTLALAHAAHLQSKASDLVNHVSEAIAPLEQGDLMGFMHLKRQEQRLAAAERARNRQIAEVARERATRIATKAADRKSQEALKEAESAAEAKGDKGELDAIRAALAAYSAPEPAPLAPEPPPAPTRPAPSRLLFAHPEARKTSAAGLPSDDAVAAAARPASAIRRLGTKLAAAFGWLLSGVGRALAWALGRLWALIGPGVARISAWLLGWGLFALLLPYGLYKAIRAHLEGEDLKYFD